MGGFVHLRHTRAAGAGHGHGSALAFDSDRYFTQGLSGRTHSRRFDGQIADGQHADEFSVFTNWQATNLFISHQPGSFFDIGIRFNGLELMAQNFFDTRIGWTLAVCHTTNYDVAVSNDAN